MLLERAPAQSKRQKLKSVLDKIEHQKKQHKLDKQRYKELEEEKSKLEKAMAERDALLKGLDKEREELCAMVGPDNDSSVDDASSAGGDDDGTFPEKEPEAAEAKLKLDTLLQEVQQLREELGYPRRKNRRTSHDEEGWTEDEHDANM